MTKRTIIFHVGQPKTGSSALQAFLSANAVRLEKAGISYPFPEGAETIASGYCSGNVMHTMQRIANGSSVDLTNHGLQLRDLFENFFAEAISSALKVAKSQTVLFSSEAIMTPSADVALPVFEQLSKDHHLQFVCFVRDPYDFAMSAWKQLTKTGKRTEGFETFINLRIENESFGLERLLKFVPFGPDLKLINYDVHRKNMISSFLDTIGLHGCQNVFDVPTRADSNPSLSYTQTAILVKAREIAKSRLFCALLTKRFRSERVVETDPYFRGIDATILDFLDETLEVINPLLPDGEELRTTLRQGVENTSDKVSLQTLRGVFDVMNEVAELEATRRKRTLPKELPVDFDPLVYLLLNPDLEAAGIDPIQHYLNNGRFEARIYS